MHVSKIINKLKQVDNKADSLLPKIQLLKEIIYSYHDGLADKLEAKKDMREIDPKR